MGNDIMYHLIVRIFIGSPRTIGIHCHLTAHLNTFRRIVVIQWFFACIRFRINFFGRIIVIR